MDQFKRYIYCIINMTLNVSLTCLRLSGINSQSLVNWEHLLGGMFSNCGLFKGLLRPQHPGGGVIGGVGRSVLVTQVGGLMTVILLSFYNIFHYVRVILLKGQNKKPSVQRSLEVVSLIHLQYMASYSDM